MYFTKYKNINNFIIILIIYFIITSDNTSLYEYSLL